MLIASHYRLRDVCRDKGRDSLGTGNMAPAAGGWPRSGARTVTASVISNTAAERSRKPRV